MAYNLGLGRTGVSASQNGTLAFVSAGYGEQTCQSGPTETANSWRNLDALLGQPALSLLRSLDPGTSRPAAIDRIDPQTGTSDIWRVDLRQPYSLALHHCILPTTGFRCGRLIQAANRVRLIPRRRL